MAGKSADNPIRDAAVDCVLRIRWRPADIVIIPTTNVTTGATGTTDTLSSTRTTAALSSSTTFTWV